MKICQIVASSGFGGLEKHVIELSNELSKIEDVTLVAPPDLGKFISKRVHFIPFDFSRSRHNPLMLWGLLNVIRKGDYDIVHAQANKAVSLLSKLSPAISAKTLGTIHNTNKNKGRPFKNIDHVIAVSKAAGSLIRKEIPMTVVYNGIRLKLDEEGLTKRQLIEEFCLQPNKLLLCGVGRLVPAKGFDLLIEAMKQVDANLLVVGEGPIKQELESQIERLELQDRIKLLGFRNDVPKILSGVDGVIISSRNEGFSYVFAEAVLLGKPVLSTDVPVANEVLDKALIMDVNVEAIRQKLDELIFNEGRWCKLMGPVWKIGKDEFTVDAMVGNTLKIYGTLLNSVR